MNVPSWLVFGYSISKSQISCKTLGESIINTEISTSDISGAMLKVKDTDRTRREIWSPEKLGSKSLKPQIGLALNKTDRKSRRIRMSNGHKVELHEYRL